VQYPHTVRFEISIMTNIYRVLSLFVTCLTLGLTTMPAAAQSSRPPTETTDTYALDLTGRNSTINIKYAGPDQINGSTHVLFVLHGTTRNATRYLAAWVDHAKKHNLLVLVPEFSNALYPRAAGYNLGNMVDGSGKAQPRELWSFAVIDRVFDDAVRRFGLSAKKYSMFGHSAGAQFTHRYALFWNTERLDNLVVANAGWYTAPTEAEYPYGLTGAPTEPGALCRYLGAPMLVLLGDQDIDPNAKNLRRNAEADRQGLSRFARGKAFFDAGQQSAARNGCAFGWRIATVPGVAHEGERMGDAAIEILSSPSPR
jgi:poly(3-hydroxybutyrate) depolymerase